MKMLGALAAGAALAGCIDDEMAITQQSTATSTVTTVPPTFPRTIASTTEGDGILSESGTTEQPPEPTTIPANYKNISEYGYSINTDDLTLTYAVEGGTKEIGSLAKAEDGKYLVEINSNDQRKEFSLESLNVNEKAGGIYFYDSGETGYAYNMEKGQWIEAKDFQFETGDRSIFRAPSHLECIGPCFGGMEVREEMSEAAMDEVYESLALSEYMQVYWEGLRMHASSVSEFKHFLEGSMNEKGENYFLPALVPIDEEPYEEPFPVLQARFGGKAHAEFDESVGVDNSGGSRWDALWVLMYNGFEWTDKDSPKSKYIEALIEYNKYLIDPKSEKNRNWYPLVVNGGGDFPPYLEYGILINPEDSRPIFVVGAEMILRDYGRDYNWPPAIKAADIEQLGGLNGDRKDNKDLKIAQEAWANYWGAVRDFHQLRGSEKPGVVDDRNSPDTHTCIVPKVECKPRVPDTQIGELIFEFREGASID
jgi:hypothetical protein